MARKPSVASLKRELASTGLELADSRQEIHSMSNDLRGALERIRDLEGDVNSYKKQIDWYVEHRDNTLEYFDMAMKLFRPHLVPDHLGVIAEPDNSQDRFLVQLRKYLSRYYDALGHTLYAEGSRR